MSAPNEQDPFTALPITPPIPSAALAVATGSVPFILSGYYVPSFTLFESVANALLTDYEEKFFSSATLDGGNVPYIAALHTPLLCPTLSPWDCCMSHWGLSYHSTSRFQRLFMNPEIGADFAALSFQLPKHFLYHAWREYDMVLAHGRRKCDMVFTHAVPEDVRALFYERYIEAVRDVGPLTIAMELSTPYYWVYHGYIREQPSGSEPVRRASI